MIDTHSHIYLSQFEDDLAQVLNNAAKAGITDIFMPSIDFSSLQMMEKLNHPNIRFYKMAGLHPTDVKELPINFEEQLRTVSLNDQIFGIGETGLDYYWSTEYVNHQKRSLHIHCELAKELKKPIILHNRDSTQDLLSIIESEQDGSLTGIWHCFNGSVSEGKRAIDLGLYLGIGGVVTFKNGGVDKTVAHLPLGKMVLETDAPYLTPSPHRGKRNEPAYIYFVAQKLAEIFGLSVDDIISKTSNTARQIFKISSPTGSE